MPDVKPLPHWLRASNYAVGVMSRIGLTMGPVCVLTVPGRRMVKRYDVLLHRPHPPRSVSFELRSGRMHAQCLCMGTFADLPSVPSYSLASLTDQLRLAVAAYLARFQGSSRYHTESDLRCYLAWCAQRGLDPLAARRPHLELYIRWMQEIRRFKPSTVSRRFSVTTGFYRTISHLQFEALLTAARKSRNPFDFALVAMLGRMHDWLVRGGDRTGGPLLARQPARPRLRVDFLVGLLAEHAEDLGEPYTRHLGGKVRELRFHLLRQQTRVSYWLAPQRRVILLTVFRKTRSAEIVEVARARRAQEICESTHGIAHEVFDREVTLT